MQQSRILFFAIIGLAVVAVIGMVLARPLLSQSLDIPTLREPVSIQVAAAPAIRPWAEQAAQEFNRRDAQIQVQIIEADGLVPASQFSANPQIAPPAAWLAEASFVVELARSEGLQQFGDALPVAETSLDWGDYADKQAAFNQTYGELSWQSIEAKAAAPGDLLTLVIASPHNSAEGLGVLISATAAHLNKTSLSAADVYQADSWLTELFRDNTRIRATPAEDFATQGRSVGDMGILSLASWQRAGLSGRSDFILTPLQPAVTLNYPLVIWEGASPAEQEAAKAFRTFLLSDSQQSTLAGFFFEQANTAQPGVQVDGEAAQALLRWAERILR